MSKFNLASALISLLTLSSGCASAKRLAIYGAPQVADIISTHEALKLPHAYEGNSPVKNEAALASAKIGYIIVAALADKWMSDHGHDPKWLRILSGVPSEYWTISNVRLIVDQKKEK